MQKELNSARTEPASAKKTYAPPTLTVHGNVEDITQMLLKGGPFQPPIRTFS